MKRLLAFVFLLSVPLFAQQRQPVSSLQEDCSVTFSFTAASSGAQAPGTVTAGSTGTSSVIDNRQVGCLDWLVTYSTTTTVTAISLAFQTATDVAGTPTTWSNYPGTINSGINPNTAVTSGGAVTDLTGPKYPFLRMNLTSFSGPGTVQGKLYGWKRRPSYVIVSNASCPGTIATPCVVVGPTPAGSAPTTSPVLVSGQTGTSIAPGTIRTIHVDANGNPIVVGPAAAGAAVSGNPVLIGGKDGSGNAENILTNVAGNVDPAGAATVQADGATNTPNVPTASGAATFQPIYTYVFNGATWDRALHCNSLATANLSGSGLTQVIAASGATSIHICHISFSTIGTEDVKISQGTGANCVVPGTPADLTGLYKSVQSFDFEYPFGTTLTGSASQALCISQSLAQAAGVTILYAQF